MNGLMKSYAEVWAAMGPDRPTAALNTSCQGGAKRICSRGMAPPQLAPKEGLMERFMRPGLSHKISRGLCA